MTKDLVYYSAHQNGKIIKIESVRFMENEKVFIGFHGTSEVNASSIMSSNFIPSENPDDWLGYGIYFFIEGINDPCENAKEWAKNCAWVGQGKPLKYSKFNVLSVLVSGRNVLDTTKTEGLNAYNEIRELLEKKEKKCFQRNRSVNQDNRVMWNLVADFLQLEIIIHNLYIRTETQRKLQIASNVPNTTVMCVKNVSNIHFDTIEKVFEGCIHHEYSRVS